MIGWLCKGKQRFEYQVEIEVVSYFPTKRKHDFDNYTPKFILDPIVKSGLIRDDSSTIITKLTLRFEYDKLNPRTEVNIYAKTYENIL